MRLSSRAGLPSFNKNDNNEEDLLSCKNPLLSLMQENEIHTLLQNILHQVSWQKNISRTLLLLWSSSESYYFIQRGISSTFRKSSEQGEKS